MDKGRRQAGPVSQQLLFDCIKNSVSCRQPCFHCTGTKAGCNPTHIAVWSMMASLPSQIVLWSKVNLWMYAFWHLTKKAGQPVLHHRTSVCVHCFRHSGAERVVSQGKDVVDSVQVYWSFWVWNASGIEVDEATELATAQSHQWAIFTFKRWFESLPLGHQTILTLRYCARHPSVIDTEQSRAQEGNIRDFASWQVVGWVYWFSVFAVLW